MPAHNDVTARRVWQGVFIGVHVAFMIMIASALVSDVRQRALAYAVNLEVWYQRYDGITFLDRWGMFGRLTLLAAGVYLTALMARGDQRVPRYYLRYVVVVWVFEWVLNMAQLTLWGIPSGTSWASYVLKMAVYAVALVAWVACVWRSKAMRATFVAPSWNMGRMSTVMVCFGALALINWPFVVNSLVDPVNDLAAWMSPKHTSAGMGFAEGLLVASVATGLFILMKNVCRMRNAWIAVLLPVSFATLFCMFAIEAFLAHRGHLPSDPAWWSDLTLR